MTTERQNQIVFACGRKASGKSQLLWELFTSQAPRVLSLDNLGESKERDRDTVEVFGMAELRRTLRAVAQVDDKGKFLYPRWHIAASVEPTDLRDLFRMLCPPIGTPREQSLSYAFGGMAIECSEAYDLAPNGRTSDDILAAWRRGRHYRLDLYMATQRPASVARELTALTDLVFAFAQREQADVDFLSQHISRGVGEQVRALRPEQYQCVRYDVNDGTSKLLDKSRRVVGRSVDRPVSIAPLAAEN